jgi:hypothetical protein
MSIEAVSAVSYASADPLDRYQMSSSKVDLMQINPAANGAHLSLVSPVDTLETRLNVDVRNLVSTVQSGMKNGFTTGDNERLMAMLQEMGTPGSRVTPGDSMALLTLTTSKTSIASLVSTLTMKVAEGFQTVVVKQS